MKLPRHIFLIVYLHEKHMIRNRDQLAVTSTHELVMDCIEQGIEATQPKNAVKNVLTLTGNTLKIRGASVDLNQYSEILILGGGKAAAQMARAIEDVIGDRLSEGVVVTNDPMETSYTKVIKGSHPTPNASGRNGAEEILSLANRAGKSTLILFPLSGGGSALLPLPAGNVSLSDLQILTRDLLESGASINEINSVRKHLSRIKGGRLAAAAAPATVIGLVISDVVGNDLGVIASGPIVGDSSTFGDAKEVLEKYDIEPPRTIIDHLQKGTSGQIAETPAPDNDAFDRIQTHVLAEASTAVERAKSVVENSEYTPIILSTEVEGESREVGKVHAAIANESSKSGNPVEPPLVLLSSGETTVTIQGDGLGGPNQEFVLSGLLTLRSDRIVMASIDTDGEDGATDAAGAIATREIIKNEDQAREVLSNNDTYGYFSDRDALIQTGPTGTNVNDLRIIAIPE